MDIESSSFVFESKSQGDNLNLNLDKSKSQGLEMYIISIVSVKLFIG